MPFKILSIAFLTWAAACAQNVRITWVGQSCFYVQTEGGPTVVVDPPVASVGYALPSTSADVVIISHNHTDHNNSAGVRGNFTLVDGRPVTQRTELTAAGMPFVQIPGFHDNTNGSARGPNTMVRWTQGGIRFAQLGDDGQESFTEAQLADLRDLDVVMIPAGGFFTVDSSQTAALIEVLKPRVAILMHFRTALGGPAQLAGLPGVAAPFPRIRYQPSTVTLTQSLPASTEVWIMEPAADGVTVNAAGFTRGMPVAPLALASVFGSFPGAVTNSFTAFPLPRQLGEAEVFIGSQAAALLFTSPGQINFQVPAGLAPGQNVLEVRIGGQRVARGSITTVARSPGLFAVADQDGRVARGRRGGFISIYGSGQGSVTPAVPDGVAAPASPSSVTQDEPAVFVGGKRATVTYSGLAPGFAGLWQINAQLAPDTPVGNDLDLVVLFESNLISNPIKIAVE